MSVETAPVRALPTYYQGVRFRSSLEASWAATFDALAITWSYEPYGLMLGDDTCYRPDFYLNAQNVWCEVKGPHNIAVEKPRRLAVDLADTIDKSGRTPMIVVLREPHRGKCVIETSSGTSGGFEQCQRCLNVTFLDYAEPWGCRVCGSRDQSFGDGLSSRVLPFCTHLQAETPSTYATGRRGAAS